WEFTRSTGAAETRKCRFLSILAGKPAAIGRDSHRKRFEPQFGKRTGCDRDENASPDVRPLLAAPRIRWEKQNASGFVRPVRESRFEMKYLFFVSLPLYLL